MIAALRLRPKLALLALVLGLAFVGALSAPTKTAAAACAALPSTLGTDTATVTAPSSATYRVWARVLAPDTTNNNFYMQIADDSAGADCSVSVGGGSSIPANTWTWVDYQNGTTSSTINATLTAGSHTITMAGEGSGVEVDRVILTGDTSCVPTGTGDNCANPPDTTPPVVAITAPANNANVSGTVTVTASATDNVAVQSVQFFVDGTAETPVDTTAPYTYSLNTTGLSVGSHTIVAKATDTSGNTASSATITVNVADTTPPTVSITAPASGATVSGTTAITATAADNVGVTEVDFYVDGTAITPVDTTSPYSVSYDTTKLTNGTHTAMAKAKDAAGNTTSSSTVSFTVNNPVTPPVDTTPPVVTIDSPASGATISGTTPISVTATDASGVAKVDFYIDGVLKNTDTTAPYTYSVDTTSLTNGAHTIKVVATDKSSNANTASTTTSVTVNNVTYLAEDINKDGHVNLIDFEELAQKFGQSGSGVGRADINGDGTVNLLDFELLASKFGQ